MPNLKLVIEYVGTAYHGWQVQPAVPTIQGAVQEALGIALRAPVLARGAARTDAGVHARGQVASVVTESQVQTSRLERSLNAILPADIAVRSVVEVPDTFHARHSARGRIYRYQIIEGEPLSPFYREFAAHYRARLDVDAMSEAAGALVGLHDFSSFRAAGDVSDSPVKEIRRSTVERSGEREDLLVYTVEATSFLQHMVRNIAGTLIEVGRGRIGAHEIVSILRGRDRRLAGPTAPARGLCLLEVLYDRLAPHGSG
ncbi:MAG TPA: tRNA pseudouridine(38-40) synthase TruA [Candidatus Polarisedimenticolia bacterium]|jgi:tRNA pseudouridine38-40 synthase